ncbi:hypothetical protein PT974_01074 [Cladobotryum mycophilum]|uniref:Uncharacterized protein n=1 Tax=Cladobotryum mycophilum TaxID=491253 RepID=A0ABR0T2W1_9HYPO
MATVTETYREIALAIGPSTDHDNMRGRTRDRSVARSKSIKPDESSTLRGRSRRRSISPFTRASRATSPAVLSPANRLQFLHGRLQDKRREHCPSRVSSPVERAFRRRQRTRSRSRGPRVEQELHRSLDILSGLRNEVFLSDEETSNNKNA